MTMAMGGILDPGQSAGPGTVLSVLPGLRGSARLNTEVHVSTNIPTQIHTNIYRHTNTKLTHTHTYREYGVCIFPYYPLSLQHDVTNQPSTPSP